MKISMCYGRSAQRAIFRQQQYFSYCFGFSLWRKLFLWHLPSKMDFILPTKKRKFQAFKEKIVEQGIK